MAKSNRLFFAVILQFVCLVSWAQVVEYVPFPTDTTKWSQSITSIGTESGGTQFTKCWDYYMLGDTMLNGTLYHKIYYKYVYKLDDYSFEPDVSEFIVSPLQLIGAIREDEDRKVYFYFLSQHTSNYDRAFQHMDAGNEYVLYDFNASVGDTLSWVPHEFNVVLAIDTVEVLENDFRLKYQFCDETSPWGCAPTEYAWITGIGDARSLFGMYTAPYVQNDVNPSLICFNDQVKNILFKDNPLLADYNHCDFYYDEDLLNTVEEAAEAVAFTFGPNPMSDILSIKCPAPYSTHISIYDVNGRLVFHHFLNTNQMDIPVNDLPIGVYFVSFNNGDQQWTEKVLKGQ